MKYFRFQDNVPWMMHHGIKVMVIAVGGFVAHKFVQYSLNRFIHRLVNAKQLSPEEAQRREETLLRIFSTSAKVVVLIIVLLMILQEVGIAIGPLLAAAGVAGLALGFGGQYLIRDLITGLFIILENQYRIGDVVCIDQDSGLVEDITLRMTTLRDLDGVVHHIPHGAVTKVANFSKEFSRVNLNIGVSYSVSLEKVIRVVNEVGKTLSEDPAWRDEITLPPHFLRVDDFADSSVTIKILGETKPLKQWEVAGELRMRLKIAFDKEGIEIPFPQRVVHMVKD
ncbi:MAG: mechanosensitive ion channel family protein [Candidatus Margulisiibacteriota bacterium]